jgi:3-polyprenyl-4-hydroxybenzoate decarboxylase
LLGLNPEPNQSGWKMLMKDMWGLSTDPSQAQQGRTSKIVIDATRQWPEEGGREKFPATNRSLLETAVPGVYAEADRLFGAMLKTWKATQG